MSQTVFISYSHKDTSWLEDLKVHLKPIAREGLVDLWDDTRIKPGQLWKEEIENALADARIAILLVSANYLASDFIVTYELPSLLESARKKGLVILQVILEPCRFSSETISLYQAINDPSRPLVDSNRGEQQRVWVNLTNAIVSTLKEDKTSLYSNDAATISPEISRVDTITKEVSREKGRIGYLDIEITLDKDFSAFSDDDQDLFLKAVRDLLKLDGELKIKKKRPGSVILTLELPADKAGELYKAIKSGLLKGAINAELINPYSIDTELSDYEPLTKIEALGKETTKRETEHFIADIEELLSKIPELIDSVEISGFRNYSRLIASMQFLQSVLAKLSKSMIYQDLSQEDIEFVKTTKLFLSGNYVTDKELVTFDQDVIKRFGKNLMVVGAEHLVGLWGYEVAILESQRGAISAQMARNRRHRIYLKNERLDKTVTSKQIEEENGLLAEKEELEEQIMLLNQRIDKARMVAGAAEGIIAVLEERVKQQYIRKEAVLIGGLVASLDSKDFQDIGPDQYDRISNFAESVEFALHYRLSKDEDIASSDEPGFASKDRKRPD